MTGSAVLELPRPARHLPHRVGGGARGAGRRPRGRTEGETLGVAGESGCGKSTIGMAPAAAAAARAPGSTGQILLDGEDVLAMKPGRLRAVRWAAAAIVFQGAQHALNPVQRIGDQIAEAIELHDRSSGDHGGSATAGAGRPARPAGPATIPTSCPAASSSG